MTLLWWLDRWRGVVFAALAGVYLLGLNGRWRITSDSAWYVLQARMMAGDSGMQAGDVALGATPPGLPVMIAALGGGAGWGTSLVMLVFAGLALWLCYQMFVEHADRPTAVLMTTLLALSGLFMEMAYSLLTELPFMVGLLLLLWGHERRLKRRKELRLALGMMLAGVVLMAAFRSVVAVVGGAYVLAEIVRVIGRKDQRRLGLRLIGLACAGAVLLWFFAPAVREDAMFFRYSLQAKTAEAWWVSVQVFMTEALPEAVFGQDVPPVLAWPASVLVVLASLIVVRVRLLWGVLLGVMLVQWIVFLSDPRYVLPVLPLVFYGVWRCGVSLLGQFSEPWRGMLFVVAALALVGANVVAVINVMSEQRSENFYAEYRNGKYAAVVGLAEVIKEQTPPEAELVVLPDIGLELAVLSERGLAVGEETPDAPRYVVGTFAEIETHLDSPGNDATASLLGSASDSRSGAVWELRRVEPNP